MHDIIILWSHPRSVSSAMERIMFERGDLTVFHEPFIYLYYLGDAKKVLKYFAPDPAHPTSYEDVRDMILAAGEKQPVFVKDMCYYLSDYIRGDDAFVNRVCNTFLIRDPAKSIPSYYRLDDEVTLEEIGLEAQYRHFERVAQVTGRPPLVLDADDVQANTESAMRVYCDALDLEFLPHALTWERTVPQAWQFVAGWHGDMEKTSGIGARESGRTKEAITLDSAPQLRHYYEHHLPFYRALREHRLDVPR
jgi:hypothetical protein